MTEIEELPIESYANCMENAEINTTQSYPGIVLNIVTIDGKKVLLIQANETFLKIAA